jgi:tRNA pseudouridine(38-40) synthase
MFFILVSPLFFKAMKLAAKSFVGEHDFRNFCKVFLYFIPHSSTYLLEIQMDIENVKNFTRVILSINVDHGVITITGFAFLWHQVITIVNYSLRSYL